ncbi:hypothetical protein NVP1121O_246 [Vibrio phage 1.121.O._10N.286.46.C4]|nr:hypothetical protein NVP1121O_246 [Vibrio phage 1.121.O._10N.286.46.C4]
MKCVGRLKRNYYLHGDKLCANMTFSLLKRHSELGLRDFIVDPELDITILDLHTYEEGLYEIITCNQWQNPETGLVEEYELKLIPYVD